MFKSSRPLTWKDVRQKNSLQVLKALVKHFLLTPNYLFSFLKKFLKIVDNVCEPLLESLVKYFVIWEKAQMTKRLGLNLEWISFNVITIHITWNWKIQLTLILMIHGWVTKNSLYFLKVFLKSLFSKQKSFVESKTKIFVLSETQKS